MDSVKPDQIMESFQNALVAIESIESLFTLRKAYTGKKSPLKQALQQIRNVPKEDRKAFASSINALQVKINEALDSKLASLENEAIAATVDAEWMDMTMPGVSAVRGSRHPLTEVEREAMTVLRRLGFILVDGPEVDNAFHNFDALNIPPHHPARDMQDTFWVTGGLLLRSHTTTVQARLLGEKPKLPIRVASMGRVYRNEAVDATHLAMFHQFEGIWIDKGLNFSHLKGVLSFIVKELYGEQPIRFKPKFYPYTEPSVGVDLQCGSCGGEGCSSCHGAGWVTILGAGMVHPKVFETFGYDPSEVSGIAFGLGTTRMAGQRVRAPTIKPLYDQQLSLLKAMHRGE
jgi:phenylalanyl-tRNA synthetase alpha chain